MKEGVEELKKKEEWYRFVQDGYAASYNTSRPAGITDGKWGANLGLAFNITRNQMYENQARAEREKTEKLVKILEKATQELMETEKAEQNINPEFEQ